MLGLAEGAIYPVLALSAKALGASPAMAGLIVALISIGTLIGNLPAAALAERYGERLAMVGASFFGCICLSLCLVASTQWLFALATLGCGLNISVLRLARHSFLTEAAPLHLRARAMSTLGGVVRIGNFIGPFLAAAVIHRLGLSGAYWTALFAMAGASVIAWSIPDLQTAADLEADDTGSAAPAHSFLFQLRQHKHALLTLGTATALLSALRSCRQIVIPLWASHIGLDATSTALIYGFMGWAEIFLFYPAGKIMDARGRLWVILPSLLTMALSFVLIPLTTGFASLLAISMLMGFGNGIGSGIIMTIGADLSPVRGRKPFLGLWRFIADTGGSGGPLFLSALTAWISLGAGIVLSSSFGLLSCFLFWRFSPRQKDPNR